MNDKHLLKTTTTSEVNCEVMSSTLPSPSVVRRDGRGLHEMRGKTLRMSELSQFDGSAWYGQGQTTVIVAINGPVAAKQENYQKCEVRVHIARASRLPTAGGAQWLGVSECREALRASDEELAKFLSDCVEAVVMRDEFPRCVLEVQLSVLADDGSLWAVAANALMCALLDAGVPCRTAFAAIAVSARDGDVLLDPTKSEEETDECGCYSHATCVFANPNSGGGLVASRFDTPSIANGGKRCLTLAEMDGMLQLAERAAGMVFTFLRNCAVPLE